MTIAGMKVLTGPNIWSIRKRLLIEMLLDLGEFEERPSSSIPGFYERLIALMPSLYRHRCSEGREGGFFERVLTGTWMGHIVEHIALELQILADMDVGFGRTRESNNKGVYHVVYAYQDAEAGLYAGRAAVRIVQAIADGSPYEIGCDLKELSEIWLRNKYGPSTESIVNEATSGGIPAMNLNFDSYVQLGYGKNQKRIEASLASTTGSIAVDIACDKCRTKQMLDNANIPVPFGATLTNEFQLHSLGETLGFPMVIKPFNGNHGNGATTDIRTMEEALSAFHNAKQFSDKVICEQFIHGNDYRILVVNYKFVAAAHRTPASVSGDGVHTVRELIDIENSDMRRGKNHDKVLTTIEVDAATNDLLEKKSVTLQTVLSKGTTLFLKPTANLSTGGTATDVTDQVHPENIALFERAARTIGLDICGIDVIAESLSTRLRDNGGVILEMNAAPGLRMHLSPYNGEPRNVAAPIIDMLFPENSSGRIPIVAITGTNGKTTTTRLIAQMMKKAGYLTGYTTTDGVYIGDELVEKGDCSGPSSARKILQDPGVEAAVLECARGGILRSGLAFDRCDVGIVTNIAEDHLGLADINTLEQLANVKSVVVEAVHENGTAVLNADDPRVYAMKDRLKSKVALFSLDRDNPAIRTHVDAGGLAAVLSGEKLLLIENYKTLAFANVNELPCTFGGTALFNVANVLAAVLAAKSSGVSMEVIVSALKEFRNSVDQTPGRMNLFEFKGFNVLLDYAHNPHGLKAIGNYIVNAPAERKIGIVTAVGDRREEDIIAVGEESAKVFDEIIIRLDDDLRGRTAENIHELLVTGIKRVDSNKPVHLFDNETTAYEFGFNQMKENYLLVMLVDDVWKGINFVREKMQAPVRAIAEASIAV